MSDIALAVGIIDFKVLEVDGFIGGLLADPEKNSGIIMTKDGLPPKRKRFTVGHELGHFLIPSHGYQRQCSKEDLEEHRRDNNYQRQETEANRFSAGLLMPKKMFYNDIDALGSADVTHIRQLGELYDVSMEAAGNRYVELTSDSCALIFSREGLIRYARPSKDFPSLAVGKGGLLPERCSTRQHTQVGYPSTWFQQFGDVWLRAEPTKRPPKILEQSLVQANGFKVTLLYLDETERDKEEDEEAMKQNWSPSFR